MRFFKVMLLMVSGVNSCGIVLIHCKIRALRGVCYRIITPKLLFKRVLYQE